MNFFSIPVGDEQDSEQAVLKLNIIGSITQYFEPLEGYKVDEVIRLVQSGEALTTIGFGRGDSFIVLLPELKNIAKIVSQEAGDDTEISFDTGIDYNSDFD